MIKIKNKCIVREKVINGKWNVSTAEPEEYPAFKHEPGIKSLGNVAIPGVLPDFSGTIRYETEFDECDLKPSEAIRLDLGEAYETVQVWINGNDTGVRICPPYSFDVTDFINAGKNILQIEVTNTLAKKLGNNWLDKAMPQEPSGLIGPVKLLYCK